MIVNYMVTIFQTLNLIVTSQVPLEGIKLELESNLVTYWFC